MNIKSVVHNFQNREKANLQVTYKRINEVWNYFISGPPAYIQNGIAIGYTKRSPSISLSKTLIQLHSKPVFK